MKGGDGKYLGAEARTNVGIPSYEVMKRGTLLVDPMVFLIAFLSKNRESTIPFSLPWVIRIKLFIQ